MTDYSTPASTVKTALDAVYAKKTDKNVFYGTCSTSATTQTKTVTADGWSFTTGNILFVNFTNGNTYNGTAQIKIGDTTKSIVTVGTTTTSRYYWKSGELVGFVYDGTNMLMLEQGTSSTTYYGVTKLSSSTSSTSETLAATPKAVKTAYDLANGKLGSGDVGAAALSNSYEDLDNKPTIPSKVSDLQNDTGFITSSSISGMLTTSDVKDNLTSTDTDKPLSAKQGKELKTLVDGILETMDCEYLISDENRYIGG